MIFKNILLVISLIFLISCDQSNLKTVKIDYKSEKKYQNSGFALIYNNNLKLKKLDQRSLKIFHKTLKARSQVKITNPLNQKSLIAEIKSNRVKDRKSVV